MELTIGEVSEKTGLSISKLRYYDEKEQICRAGQKKA